MHTFATSIDIFQLHDASGLSLQCIAYGSTLPTQCVAVQINMKPTRNDKSWIKSRLSKSKSKPTFKSNSRVLVGAGIPCPRCKQTSAKYQHGADWKPSTGKKYYEYWFQCHNQSCETKQFYEPGKPPTKPEQSLTDQLKALYGVLYEHTQISREEFARQFHEGGLNQLETLALERAVGSLMGDGSRSLQDG